MYSHSPEMPPDPVSFFVSFLKINKHLLFLVSISLLALVYFVESNVRSQYSPPPVQWPDLDPIHQVRSNWSSLQLTSTASIIASHEIKAQISSVALLAANKLINYICTCPLIFAYEPTNPCSSKVPCISIFSKS